MKKQKSCTLSQSNHGPCLTRAHSSSQHLNREPEEEHLRRKPTQINQRRQLQQQQLSAKKIKSKNSPASLESDCKPIKSIESLFDVHKPLDFGLEDFQSLLLSAELPRQSSLSCPAGDKSFDEAQGEEGDFQDPSDLNFLKDFIPDFTKSDPNYLHLKAQAKEKNEENLIKDADELLPAIESQPIFSQIISNDSDLNEEDFKLKEMTENSYAPPDYPVPGALGQGVPVGKGHSSSSLVECLPFEDTAVMNEISQFQEEARRLKEEIQNLKAVIQRINQNDCLTKEMTSELSDVQGDLAEKLCKMNAITRKLERLMGLVDPGTETFAKMFDMKPFPHDTVTCVDCPKKKNSCDTQSCTNVCNEDLLECDKKSCDTEPCKGGCDKYIFPEIDYPEDKLPRLIVCGNTEEDFPKIVVADSRPHSRETCPVKKTQESVCQLAKENTELESSKFQLERKLLEKDEELQRLQRKVCSLQAEMRAVQKTNTDLSTTVDCLVKNKPPPSSPCQKTPSCPVTPTSRTPCLPQKKSYVQTSTSGCGQPTQQKSRCCGGGNDMHEAFRLHGGASACCGGGGGGCSAGSKSHNRNKSHERGNNIEEHVQNLCEQLSNIECEVRMMQDELTCKQNSQQDQTPCKVKCDDQACTSAAPKKSARPCPPPPGPKAPQADCCESNLSELKEQYKRLQDDYKSKLCEVSQLRSNTDDLRRNAREAREERDRLEVQLCDALERIRNIESERDRLLGCNEQMIEQEQALIIARQRFRETQDELEELRTMIRDQAEQLDEYRSKYLHAQQQVEEQRRQLDLMEMDNARMNENVTLEINRVKNQFQEKLAELAPLPEILKQTQVKLQETQQYRLIAEHNCEDLSRELLATKDTIDDLQKQLNSALKTNEELQEEKNDGGGIIDQLEVKNGQLRTENERQKNNVCRLEEQTKTLQKRLDEKTHEVIQLTSMLEQVREDSARQVARTKERCEAIKKSMQGQISDFEVQLAQCRAAAKTAQNERDEIRKKMQGQICNLNDALQQAQGRIRSLQGHVDFLKVSYSNVFGDNDPSDQPGCGQTEQVQLDCGQIDNPAAGYDTCDCSY